MLIHRNRRHFHLMPTYRPFFNDYLPHSLSKWALHPRLFCAPNFIGKKKTPPSRLLIPPPFYFDPRMCFWICWLCIRTSMETLFQVLAFIIFHRDKTKQQRDGRGHRGVEGGHDGRKWGGGVGDCPGWASHCWRDKVCQCGIASLSDCVSCLLKSLTSLPTLPEVPLSSL